MNAVIDEVIERDDPALYDWILDAAYDKAAAQSRHWEWRTDDTREYGHPALEPESVLRLIARGNSQRAKELRAAVSKLCIQRDRYAVGALDVGGCERLTSVTKLRVLGHEPEGGHAWRKETAAKARPIIGFAAIGTMTALEHLTLIACQVDPAVLAQLPALRFLEIIGGDLADIAPLADSAIEHLALVGCKQLTTIAALPRGLQRLHVEDCAVDALPATRASVVFERAPIERTAMTRSVFETA